MLKKRTADAKVHAISDDQPEKKNGIKCPRGDGKVSDLNRSIVAWAVAQLGKKVGNGECWTLIAEAFKQVGAEPPRGYVFGREIPLEDATPGDILQFTSARFETARYYKILGLPDHTAIIYSISGNSTFLLHQNFGSKKVTTLDVDFRNLVSGSVRAYRPAPKER